MRNIKIEGVTKTFHDDIILENVSLTIPGGTFFALLGPSGSGKTTLLRLIAGLETVDSGTIFLGSTNITNMPINERRINTVFQNYALFPHMNVFDNIAYGLAIRRISKEIIEQKVIKVLKMVHLDRFIYKSIDQLSGGQQQRVALARAIINEPDVLLLDEPLAALDLKLRERMLVELIELQDQLKTTFVYVTHDQSEALTVADSMAIMNQDGYIEQVGRPKEIYEFPTSIFVANFVGTTNIIHGTLCLSSTSSDRVELSNGLVVQVVVPIDKIGIVHGGKVSISLRPEKIEICKQEQLGFANMLRGTVQTIVYHGRSTQYNVRVADDLVLQVFEQNEEHFPQEVIDYDDQVYLYWQKENVVLLNQ